MALLKFVTFNENGTIWLYGVYFPPPPFSFLLLFFPPISFSAQGGYSAPSFSPWQGSLQGIPRTVPPQRRQSESVLLTHIPPLCSSSSLPFARTVHHVAFLSSEQKQKAHAGVWHNLSASCPSYITVADSFTKSTINLKIELKTWCRVHPATCVLLLFYPPVAF